MNEHRYKEKHLQDYQGILTSHNRHNGTFKMALKVENNPVLERSIEKIESSIQLEFYYNMGLSTLFFHDIHACPLRDTKKCPNCEDIKDRHYKFDANLDRLQVGDTFRIKAALINDKVSELQVRIQSFKDYEPLTAACTEYSLRLPDTPEGINKKYELEEQKLQREREEEQRRKEKEENRIKEKDRRKKQEKWDRIEEWLGKRKNIQKFLLGYLVGILSLLIPLILMIHKSCSTP